MGGMRFLKAQIAIGFAVLVLLVTGTALVPAEYPQEDEDVHGGLEIAGPYGVQKIPEITSAITFPKYSGQAMVYKTVDTAVSKDDALKIAEKFGLTGSLEVRCSVGTEISSTIRCEGSYR